MGRIAALAAVAGTIVALITAAPASADPPPPGCARDLQLGLHPQIREICDTAIQPDGSWTRFRGFSHPTYVHSTCGGVLYDGGQYCPWWNPYRDTIPAEQSDVDTYVVTWDTIPDGEPGHIDGA